MNFLTESLDLPQNEQRKWRSWDIDVMGALLRPLGLPDWGPKTIWHAIFDAPPRPLVTLPRGPAPGHRGSGYFASASCFSASGLWVITLSISPYDLASS